MGLISFTLTSLISIAVFFGGLGSDLAAYSPIIALVVSLATPPIIAYATKGQFYMLRASDGIECALVDALGNPSNVEYTCVMCNGVFERFDMCASVKVGSHVCSLCLSVDRDKDHIFYIFCQMLTRTVAVNVTVTLALTLTLIGTQ